LKIAAMALTKNDAEKLELMTSAQLCRKLRTAVGKDNFAE
jgi:hypothetical protein